jgi:large subunit ribosomal protein L4e
MNLPNQFDERVREDIIKRAFLSIKSQERENYGADPEAGNKHVTYFKKRNDAYRGQKGKGMSRTPRKIMIGRGERLIGEGAEAPNTRGGRTAHPPTSDRDFSEEINTKERRKAIRSALAATASQKVEEKHMYQGTKPIVTDEIESVEKTSELEQILKDQGLEQELERCSTKSVRSGRGKTRGRKYRSKTGPLLVISETTPTLRAGSNIPGVEVSTVSQLNARKLAPGGTPGRLTVYSEKALEKMQDEGLFK